MTSALSAPSSEVAFLLHCVGRFDVSSTEELQRLASRVQDWNRVIALAVGHAVVPIVAQRVSHAAPASIPAEIIASIQSAARHGATRSLQLAGQLLSIVQELDARGIESLPIKGPTLAALVYGNLSMRLYEDLDVLVHDRDIGRASLVLADLNYRQKHIFNDSRDLLLKRFHHETFIHPENAVTVELHWSLNHRTLFRKSLEDSWWDKPQRVKFGGMELPTLGPETLLLYLSIHAAKHSWARIGWLCDVHRALSRFPAADWQHIWRLAEQTGTSRMVGITLLLIRDLFDASALTSTALEVRPSTKITEEIAAHIRLRILSNPEYVPDLEFALQMQLRDGLKDRARLAIHILAEPWPADVLALEMPRVLRGAYYAFRPVRLASKYLLRRLNSRARRDVDAAQPVQANIPATPKITIRAGPPS